MWQTSDSVSTAYSLRQCLKRLTRLAATLRRTVKDVSEERKRDLCNAFYCPANVVAFKVDTPAFPREQ